MIHRNITFIAKNNSSNNHIKRSENFEINNKAIKAQTPNIFIRVNYRKKIWNWLLAVIVLGVAAPGVYSSESQSSRYKSFTSIIIHWQGRAADVTCNDLEIQFSTNFLVYDSNLPERLVWLCPWFFVMKWNRWIRNVIGCRVTLLCAIMTWPRLEIRDMTAATCLSLLRCMFQ